MQLKEYLKNHRVIPDGSMGTYYSNLVGNNGAVSELANLTAPEIIKQIHKEYIAAGAGMLRTNTFAGSRAVLQIDLKQQQLLIKAACNIAKNAAKESEVFVDQGQLWIFGDIGPIPQDANTQEDEVLQEYRLLCDIFIEEGLDGIHFETFSNLTHIEKLVSYIKEKKEDMFILTSFSFNKSGYTNSGISVRRILEKVSQIDGIDGCGFNCGVGSGHMYQLLRNVIFPDNKLIYAAPNAGYPEQMQNRMVFMDNADYFAENMERIAGLGVNILGGCCGTTPEYTRKLVKRIKTYEPATVHKKTEDLKPEALNVVIKGNDFYEMLQNNKKVIAVELDPPYDANVDQIMECAHFLKSIGADMITFADSPMGRSRVDSILMSIKIANETGMNVMPHICCRDKNMISMRSSILGAYIHGIRNLLIVTGDPVPGESRVKATGVFDYNSVQLMEYVKEMNGEHFLEEPFYFGGALNFGRGSLEKVIERMKRKIDAGAKYFLTQPIYSLEDAERIKSIKEKLDTKILCGIMPFVSYRNACFIKNEFSGIHVPDGIVNRYHPQMTREEAENVGALLAVEIMERLNPVADGYYFMLPFNRVSMMEKIINHQT